jgi:predicted O-methyltransferase YrrM
MTLAIPIGRYCLRLLPRSQAVPIGRIRFLRTISFGRDPLFPLHKSLKETGKLLRNPILSRALAEDETGMWSMSAATLDFLESEIRHHNPRLLVEFGSGLSTICFAQYMQALHGGSGGVYVYSIEQSAEVVASTLCRLQALRLEQHVRMFHAPLVLQTIEGVSARCYSLPRNFESAIADVHPDFVVIDGPAAQDGARFGTLPLIRRYLSSGARFYLDDALRDGEIDIAERWARLPYVQVNVVRLTEKGLLLGEVR